MNQRLHIKVDHAGRGSITDLHTGLAIEGVKGFVVRAHVEQATTIELTLLADELILDVEAEALGI